MTRPTRPLAGHDDLPVMTVHACLRGGRGGSPTAVVDETPWRRAGRPLTDGVRRLVPTVVGASHAVFLSDDRDPADRRGNRQPVLQVRFFTPETELPACGHGTLAALAFLSARTGDREYHAELWASGRVIKGRTVRRVSLLIDVTFMAGRGTCVRQRERNSRYCCPLWVSPRRPPPELALRHWDAHGQLSPSPPSAPWPPWLRPPTSSPPPATG
ncbi:PhzF family phenazine biosynthesis protein [Streptomyces echinatus]|uniref:PhzF family phenazine biosynthesis protein n=1 Tax=Streptomyces echinatus TaxID=67293 RepID=UPI0037B6D157